MCGSLRWRGPKADSPMLEVHVWVLASASRPPPPLQPSPCLHGACLGHLNTFEDIIFAFFLFLMQTLTCASRVKMATKHGNCADERSAVFRCRVSSSLAHVAGGERGHGLLALRIFGDEVRLREIETSGAEILAVLLEKSFLQAVGTSKTFSRTSPGGRSSVAYLWASAPGTGPAPR